MLSCKRVRGRLARFAVFICGVSLLWAPGRMGQSACTLRLTRLPRCAQQEACATREALLSGFVCVCVCVRGWQLKHKRLR